MPVPDALIDLLEDPELNISSYNEQYYFFTYNNEKHKTLDLIKLLNTTAHTELDYNAKKTMDAGKSVYISGFYVSTKEIKIIDKATADHLEKLNMYGAKVHFARYPEDKDKLIKNPDAKITQVTIHFNPAIFYKQIHQKPGPDGSAIIKDTHGTTKITLADTTPPSKPPFICVLDPEGPHTLENCLKDENALETKYENKYNYKYLKYKMKYLNLKLLNK